MRFEEPDLVISLGDVLGDYAIACRKTYSENNVGVSFRDKCDQIVKHGRPGIVAFNLDDITPEDEKWQFPTERELRAKLNGFNADFVRANDGLFRSAIERGDCDGILVSTTVISNVLEVTPGVNVTHATYAWNLGASVEAQIRFKAFTACLDRVVRRRADPSATDPR